MRYTVYMWLRHSALQTPISALVYTNCQCSFIHILSTELYSDVHSSKYCFYMGFAPLRSSSLTQTPRTESDVSVCFCCQSPAAFALCDSSSQVSSHATGTFHRDVTSSPGTIPRHFTSPGLPPYPDRPTPGYRLVRRYIPLYLYKRVIVPYDCLYALS